MVWIHSFTPEPQHQAPTPSSCPLILSDSHPSWSTPPRHRPLKEERNPGYFHFFEASSILFKLKEKKKEEEESELKKEKREECASWGYTQKTVTQVTPEAPAHPCLLQHYSQ
jgi:hypothetical protein